ncbi:hypothetical protein [Sphingopyxis sp. R3-92]|uniref:hypothetical protein n=1 Tax=Sphingopyxis sp. R3-92 TaxID=3158553 RepID=UPI003EE77F76
MIDSDMRRAGPKDHQRALALFDKACSPGEPKSCFSRGRACQTGNGRDAEVARAIALLERVLMPEPKTASAAKAEKALALARLSAKYPEATPASKP